MECKCPDWEPNTKKLNSYLQMGVIHGMGDWKAVNGKPFQFCPWCGTLLEEKSQAPVNLSDRNNLQPRKLPDLSR